jgi:membrane fusion protein (multidrug efflux system)
LDADTRGPAPAAADQADTGRPPGDRPAIERAEDGVEKAAPARPREEAQAPRAGSSHGRLRTAALVLVALAAIAGALVRFWSRILLAFETVSTDDAHVAGHVTYVAPRVPGTILRVHVDDNQYVERGRLLVELDPEPYQIGVHRARAAVGVAEAQAKQAVAQGAPSWRVSGPPGTT